MLASKFRKLVVGAVVGAALLLVGASGASASPAHTVSATKPVVTASADASCESGFETIKDGYGYYMTGEGVNNPVETTTDNNYCWKPPGDGGIGPIKNEAGQVLRWDSAAGEVLLASSYAGVEYEQWEPESDDGATIYISIWQLENTMNGVLLYAINDSGSSKLSAAGVNINVQSLWSKGS